LLEQRDAEHLQDLLKTGLQRQALLPDRHQYVDRLRNPDLTFDGILARAANTLDPMVQPDPLKEEFNPRAGL
jgi:hypothetical protein